MCFTGHLSESNAVSKNISDMSVISLVSFLGMFVVVLKMLIVYMCIGFVRH